MPGQSTSAKHVNAAVVNRPMRRSMSFVVLFWSVCVAHCNIARGADAGATSLRISAKIDGKDELHISHLAAGWVHRSWGWPTEVRINGQSWSPRRQRSIKVGPNTPLLRRDIALAGATIRKIRGRGDVSLGYGKNGLIVRFNDESHNGAATYEVRILFADSICKESRTAVRSLKSASGEPLESVELNIRARVDGADAVHVSSADAKWAHYEWSWPRGVSINGRSWDPQANPELGIEPESFFPAGISVANAQLIEQSGRGAVQLLPARDRLTVRFDDRQPGGAGDYVARVRIPISQLWRVEVQCDEPLSVAGARMTVVRCDQSGHHESVVSVQHVFDHRGRTILALPSGRYRFEVQHQPRPDVLVSLRSPLTAVSSATTVQLPSVRVPTPKLNVTGHRGLELTQLGIRSILPTGALAWKRDANTSRVSLILSPEQRYRVRAFGSGGSVHAALWKELETREIRRITQPADQLFQCSFGWHEEALRPYRAGVKFVHPDSVHEFGVNRNTLLLTNRRFLQLGYWFQIRNGRRLVFHPRGYVLPDGQSDHYFELGGPLAGHASAAILTNENLGSPQARQLWTDICVIDPNGHVLDRRESTVDWKSEVQMRDGEQPPEHPLTPSAIERLGNVTDTVLLSAQYQLERPVHLVLSPERFEPRRSKRVSTNVPSYMQWRATAYLAKAERSLSGIASEREIPINPSYRVKLSWWLNSGAVGGHGGFTMPLSGMVQDFNWFTHPWAISHELLHGFGYGHNEDMNRTDRAIQRRFREHQWFVADHPEYAPEMLSETAQ